MLPLLGDLCLLKIEMLSLALQRKVGFGSVGKELLQCLRSSYAAKSKESATQRVIWNVFTKDRGSESVVAHWRAEFEDT